MTKMCIALMMLASAAASAQQEAHSIVFRNSDEQIHLTGNIQVDLFGQHELSSPSAGLLQSGSEEVRGTKSPFLAAGLSLVVPGAGELYAGSYWKAALFFAADVAFWALAYSNDKKGDDQTDFFQQYADNHWSAVRYAEFSLQRHIPEGRRAAYANLINPNANLPHWQRVDWALLNQMEREISGTAEGRYYSHTLPIRPEQQYYELIGKYPQYNQGWDDARPDWSYSETDVTERFKYYANQRGKANDYYNTATTFVTVAVINHVISALDAAWSAANHNKRLHASMQLRKIPVGDGYARVPMAKLAYSF